jgi:hypothetical protein
LGSGGPALRPGYVLSLLPGGRTRGASGRRTRKPPGRPCLRTYMFDGVARLRLKWSWNLRAGSYNLGRRLPDRVESVRAEGTHSRDPAPTQRRHARHVPPDAHEGRQRHGLVAIALPNAQN